MTVVTVRQAWSDALRYWEPRRGVYNLALALVAAVVFLTNLPSSRASLTFDTLQDVFALAVLANIAYSVAHVIDLALQLSAYRLVWLRRRWVLLAIGIAFGTVLANFLSHSLFVHPIYLPCSKDCD